MTDFVARLARKWCPQHKSFEGYNFGYRCCCEELAAAIAEALTEAEKVVLTTPNGMHYGPGVEDFTVGMVETAIEGLKKTLAARLAALREGR